MSTDTLDRLSRLKTRVTEPGPRPQEDTAISVNLEDLSQLSTLKQEKLNETESVVPVPAGTDYEEIKSRLMTPLMERIDILNAARLNRDQLAAEITSPIDDLLKEQKINLNGQERRALILSVVDDMLGLGPLGATAGR